MKSDADAFTHILASLYEAMLDDTQWPATSALIDAACGTTGNALVVGPGPRSCEPVCPTGPRKQRRART